MQILAIGDVIGRPGREALRRFVPELRQKRGLDLVIANGENAASGLGLTLSTAEEMLDAGVDVITSGNHIWAHKEFVPYLDMDMPVIRPLNFPVGVPGKGYIIKNNVMVVNLIGRTFMTALDSPFQVMNELLTKEHPPIIIVDFHAEATSEKGALGRYLDGRVTAVLGTHTHVGTIDSQILPRGTAFVTDIGMTGPVDSIIGDDTELVISRFLTSIPYRLSVGKGRTTFTAMIVTVDEKTGKASRIERFTEETS